VRFASKMDAAASAWFKFKEAGKNFSNFHIF
jgi:hypothetical protein